jgi:hypothetical protein
VEEGRKRKEERMGKEEYKTKKERIIRKGGQGERKRHYRVGGEELLISRMPQLLQDLTTKYGRDIAPIDKSLYKVLNRRENSKEDTIYVY